jgi:cell division protein FtsQ
MSAARAVRGRATRAKPRATASKKMAQARANKLAGLAFGGFMLAIALIVLIALDLPAKAMNAAGEAVGEAGLRVRAYEITGLNRMARKPVDAIVASQVGRAQPLVDVQGIREQLLAFGWVKDARVSRRLPDTLVIDIVEREPAALWQDRQRLTLVDAEGVVLDRVRVDQMPDLPLLIGTGANRRTQDLRQLIDAVPTLKPQLASASWVGQRRWDLAFQSGETVALPEGAAAARRALVKFANIDKSAGLLGRGLKRFDLRVPGKMIVRLPQVPEPQAAQPPVAG